MSDKKIPYSKYSGAGNSFLFFDNRSSRLFLEKRSLKVRHLCAEYQVEGVILIENSSSADVRMRIYNADGGEAEMCGNGMRCLYRYCETLGYAKNSLLVETHERLLRAERRGEDVAIDMGSIEEAEWNFTLDLPSGAVSNVHFVNTGVPHLVKQVTNPHIFPLEDFAKEVQAHSRFEKHGTNVNVFSQKESNLLELKTYERGVGESPACGTGATATALALAYTLPPQDSYSIRVRVASGDHLTISFDRKKCSFEKIFLCGPAKKLEDGVLPLDLQ